MITDVQGLKSGPGSAAKSKPADDEDEEEAPVAAAKGKKGKKDKKDKKVGLWGGTLEWVNV